MEKIEGVDLASELAQAEADIMAEQRSKVRALVGYLITDISKWQREKYEAQKSLAKLDEKIKQARAKYEKIKAGDWSILNENMNKPQPTSEKNDG